MSGEKRRQRVRMRGGQTKVETKPSSVKKGKLKINYMKATIIPFVFFLLKWCFGDNPKEKHRPRPTRRPSTSPTRPTSNISSQSTTTRIVTIVIIVNTVNIVNIVSIANIVIIVTIVEIINIVYIVEKIL